MANDPNIPSPASTGQPFIGPTQSKRVHALCIILVAGVDVTAKLKPHLINVHVIDGGATPSATVELDDRDSKMPIPPIGAPMDIMLGWKYESMVSVFTGFIEDVESGFGRTQGGRRLWVYANGVSMAGEIKTSAMNTAGEGPEPGKNEGTKVPFQDIFTKAFAKTGLQAKVHESLNVKRDFFMQNNESPMQYGQRMADELGGIFRMNKGNAEITKPGENADGSSTGTIYAKWGDNLIGWRVHVKIMRSTYSRGEQQSYNPLKGSWDRLEKAFNNPMGSGEEGAAGQTGPAANETQSEQQTQGSQNESDSSIADGRIVINGEPRAKFGQYVELINARPNVDGTYFCPMVEHIYSREGYITWLDVVSTRHVGTSETQVGASMQYVTKTGEIKQYLERVEELKSI